MTTDFLDMEGYGQMSISPHPETASMIARPDQAYLNAVADLYITSFDYYMIAYMHNKFSDYPIREL